MNELFAIILIVLLCCFLFFAWLFALATCPDRMVNLISGTKQNSSSPISRASEDLAAAVEDGIEKEDGGQEIRQPPRKKTSISLLPILGQKKSAQQKKGGGGAAPLLVCSRSIPSNRSNGFLAAQLCAEKRANSKKLSVVPEADEQLTVTSITQCLRPSQQSKSPAKIVEGEEKAAMVEEEKSNGDGKTGKEDPLLTVKTVLLNRHPSDCSSSTNEQNEDKKGGEKADNNDKANANEQKAEPKGKDDEEEEDEEKVLLARRSAPPGCSTNLMIYKE